MIEIPKSFKLRVASQAYNDHRMTKSRSRPWKYIPLNLLSFINELPVTTLRKKYRLNQRKLFV